MEACRPPAPLEAVAYASGDTHEAYLPAWEGLDGQLARGVRDGGGPAVGAPRLLGEPQTGEASAVWVREGQIPVEGKWPVARGRLAVRAQERLAPGEAEGAGDGRSRVR